MKSPNVHSRCTTRRPSAFFAKLTTTKSICSCTPSTSPAALSIKGCFARIKVGAEVNAEPLGSLEQLQKEVLDDTPESAGPPGKNEVRFDSNF